MPRGTVAKPYPPAALFLHESLGAGYHTWRCKRVLSWGRIVTEYLK